MHETSSDERTMNRISSSRGGGTSTSANLLQYAETLNNYANRDAMPPLWDWMKKPVWGDGSKQGGSRGIAVSPAWHQGERR
jgi:hypothetical protein